MKTSRGENANAAAELVIGFMIALRRTVPQYHREMLASRSSTIDRFLRSRSPPQPVVL
jgi:phosphoglycerate dehydrogenase-like enzyme